MSLKKKATSAIASAMVLGSLFAAPAANASGNPSKLDQGDLTQACQMQYGPYHFANLFGTTAYSWKCVVVGSTSKWDINVNNYCMTIWSVWAIATNPNDPNSWKCQGY
ncbi:hypothetical protein KC949_03275 [Candidatus Saccharibacteria bacterium]|nr:hypothetical protein [Candidatus Saccharibacteria bacterium]